MREPDDLPGQTAALVRFGRVAEVDLAAARCVVDTGEVRTGPVKWIEGAAGATRTWSPPSVGEQVLLLAPEGDLEMAVALRGLETTAFPPVGRSARELIRFADGAVLAYDPEGHVLDVDLPPNAIANISAAIVNINAAGGVVIDAGDGGVTVKGDLAVSGDIHATGEIASDEDVIADTVSLKDHVHLGVTAGQAVSGKPRP